MGWLHMIETMDGLTEGINFIRINLGKQGIQCFHINCNMILDVECNQDVDVRCKIEFKDADKWDLPDWANISVCWRKQFILA